MNVDPADNIDTLGLPEKCLDILRQAGVETLRQFVEVEWRDFTTICGATPRKLHAILRLRDQIRPSLAFNQKQDTPMRYEQVRIPPNNDTKIPDQHLQPDQSPQLTLQLAPELSQRLHPGFLPSLGLSVRAMNVLAQMDLETTAQFIALDKETLLRKRNCGKKTVAEIMAVVTRYKPSSEVTSAETDMMSLSPAQENASVTNLRLSVRATNVLEHLKISTVGQLTKVSDEELLNVQNFGRKSLREVRSKLAAFCSGGLVIWPSGEQTAGKLSRRITRDARKLQRLRNTSAVLCDDPRFGHLIKEMGLNVTNLREAADILASRKSDPVNPQSLVRRLVELLKNIRTASRMTLEAELFSLTDGLGSARDRRIIVDYLGWDGKPPRTLEVVGQEHDMTRERVRQICKRIKNQHTSKPFLPVLDRVVKVIAAAVPVPAEEIESQLLQRRLTENRFSMEAICSTAHVLGREVRFTVHRLHEYRFVLLSNSTDQFDHIDHVVRAAVRHWGVATVDDVAAAMSLTPTFIRKVLIVLPGFKWLDEATGWFWIVDVTRNALLTQIRKVLAVSLSIAVGELRTGVGRHHRRKGFAPPRRVLLELCQQLPWCRVADEMVTATQSLNPNEVLSDSEQRIFQILKEHGPVMQRQRFENLCVNAGVNRHTFWIFLSYCPIITRYAAGVYGLRGAQVTAGLVESLMPKTISKSKLVIDYGWTKDRNIRILYRISPGMLSNGVVSIPAAMKTFLQGRFTLMTGDNSHVGELVVKDTSAWGFGPFYSRRGGEPGDYLSVVFNPSERVVVVQIGDASLADQLGDSENVVADQTTSTKVNGPAIDR